ncbi:MAG TPA: type II secretion system protein GspC [Polyangiaceae bacterium]|nr:type II secretion system protein GspC [Polyangiaceae bacterium]
MSSAGYLKPLGGLLIVSMLLVSGFQVTRSLVASWPTWLFPSASHRTRQPTSRPPRSPPHIEAHLAGLTPPVAAKDAPIVISPCQEISASIVTESSDPTWSSAVLKTATEARGRSHRVGDIVAGWKLELVGYNARASSPAVWFSKGRQVCRLDLFSQGAAPVSATSGKMAAATRKGPSAMEGRVRRVSEREVEVDRSVVNWILEDPSTLMGDVRVTPERRDGDSIGLRLVHLGVSGILPTLGLRPGDVVRGVNGFNLANPAQALEAYARLRTASRLELRLLRGGRELTLEYDIR